MRNNNTQYMPKKHITTLFNNNTEYSPIDQIKHGV